MLRKIAIISSSALINKVLVLALTFFILLSIPANTFPSNVNSKTAMADAAMVNEPLILSSDALTRTFSFPTVKFFGNNSGFLDITTTWYPNGTTSFSDSRGYHFALDIPNVIDGTFVTLQNSTVVDQRFTSSNLNYDIYWKIIDNSKNEPQRYKFWIVGNSLKDTGSTISLRIKQPELDGQSILLHQNRFLVSRSDNGGARASPDQLVTDLRLDDNTAKLFDSVRSSSIIKSTLGTNSSLPEGLGIDWSDAASSGYAVNFDRTDSTLDIPVGESFDIDPEMIDAVNVAISPASSDYYEGERRVVSIVNSEFGNVTFAFYYDGTEIAYENSTDGGYTWGVPQYMDMDPIPNDMNRWTIVNTIVSGSPYISVLYWQQVGSNMTFNAQRGSVVVTSTGVTITWSSAISLFSTAANAACGTGSTCAAAVATTDTSGKVYAAFRWIPSGASTYQYKIMDSTNGGLSWSTTLAQQNSGSGTRPEMALTKLSSGKMLFVFALYGSSELSYRIFDGTSTWSNVQSTTGANMTVSSIKQISSDSDSTNSPYVAYLTGGNSGTLMVARWTNTGTFQSFETADNTMSHKLPSITIPDDNIVRIYTLSNNRIYVTQKINGAFWYSPVDAFGIAWTFDAPPNDLTAAVKSSAGLWLEQGDNELDVWYGSIIENPYAAFGYSRTLTSPIVANKFIGYNDFKGTSGDSLSSDLLSIISVGGVNTTAPSGSQLTDVNYQQAVRADNDYTVRADPQVWLVNLGTSSALMGCFLTNNCPILASVIDNLDYVYQTFYWNTLGNQVTFYTEAHLVDGSIVYNTTTYNKSPNDPSNGFAVGFNDQLGTHSPQLGVESDFETYGWQIKQYNWQYYLANGTATNFSSQPFELIRADDPFPYSSSITPDGGTVGTNPYDVQGDFNCNNSSTPTGTINWSHASSASSIITDGKRPWPVTGLACN